MHVGRSIGAFSVAAALTLGGCFTLVSPENADNFTFNNTTDPSNSGARYVSSAACRACHPGVDAEQSLHGHRYALNAVRGVAPTTDPAGGVPNPPAGFRWTDVSYVIGGYAKKALFIDQRGFVLTDGAAGTKTQWNLAVPANGTQPSFVAFKPEQQSPLPYDFAWFQFRTTGPRPQDPDRPLFQDNRPGLLGTWQEPGVRCEACHGPGSKHVPNPHAREIFVDPTGDNTCRQCHSRPFGSQSGEILAEGGFIVDQQQWPELASSGGHADFDCTICHDPHRSVTNDRAAAIRNECTACHSVMTMAGHGGKVFQRGDYRETLSCESCHMPFASKAASSAGPDIVGPVGRAGDTRTHIFRISTATTDFHTFFSNDGMQVRRDANGQAAVTVDFVCLRCHNGLGNVFELTLPRAAEIAGEIHRLP